MANSYNVGGVNIAITAEVEQFFRDMQRARQEAQRSGNAVGSSFRQNTDGVRAMGSQVQQVRERLRAMGNEATRTLRQLRTGLMAGTAAAGAMAAGFVVMFRRATAAAESISDMARQTNTAVEALQELRFAADQNGSSAGAMDTALQRLNSSIGDTIRGQGSARNAFRMLGLEQRIVQGELRGTDEVFMAVVRAMEDIPDAATRASLASEILGRQGRELSQLMGLGAEGIAAARDRARELGIVLREDAVEAGARANVRMRELGDSIKTQMTGAILEAAPAIQRVMEQVAAFIPVLTEWALKVTDLFESIGGGGLSGTRPGEAAQQLEDLAGRFGRGETVRLEFETVLGGRLHSALGNEGGTAFYEQLMEAMRAERDGTAEGAQRARMAAMQMLRRRAEELRRAQRDRDQRAETETPTLPTVTPPGTTGGNPADVAEEAEEVDRLGVMLERLANIREVNKRVAQEAQERANALLDTERRHELDLARLRGDSAEIERLEREEAIRSRVAELMELQVGYAEALNRATNEANERDQAADIGIALANIEAQREDWRRMFQFAFTDAMRAAADGDVGGVVRGLADQFSYRIFDELGGQLFDQLFGGIFDQQAAAITGAAQGQAAGIAIGTSMTAAGATSATTIAAAMQAAGAAAAGMIASAMSTAGGISGGLSLLAGLPGFNSGGSMMLGGRAGVDRNLLSLNGQPIARVSRGEMLNVVAANKVNSPIRALARPGEGGGGIAVHVGAINAGSDVSRAEVYSAIREATQEAVTQSVSLSAKNTQTVVSRTLTRPSISGGR